MNDKKHVVPSFPTPTADRPLPVAVAHPVRSALWADDRLREQYLDERGASLAPSERELIASSEHRKTGSFVIFKHLRSHSILMNEGVFAVLGLYSPIGELVPSAPAYVEAVLLPFGDRIVIDGILSSPGMQLMFGPGKRRAFAKQYADARARSQIQTSLLPSAPRSERESRAHAPPKRGRKAESRPRSVVGKWRITQSEHWDRDALDLIEQAFIRFDHDQLGELAMIAVRADLDARFETDTPRVDFSFVGDDEGTPCSGRGWAALGNDDVLHGRLYFHRGDDSSFEAERIESRQRSGRGRRVDIAERRGPRRQRRGSE